MTNVVSALKEFENRPKRIRRSRAKGWKLPDNAVIVDRTSKWGNPFVVSEDGIAAQCVHWYALLLQGYMMLGRGNDCMDRQETCHKALRTEAKAGWSMLRGKDLACWCASDKPCHADVLLHAANDWTFDIVDYMRFHGYRYDKRGCLETA